MEKRFVGSIESWSFSSGFLILITHSCHPVSAATLTFFQKDETPTKDDIPSRRTGSPGSTIYWAVVPLTEHLAGLNLLILFLLWIGGSRIRRRFM